MLFNGLYIIIPIYKFVNKICVYQKLIHCNIAKLNGDNAIQEEIAISRTTIKTIAICCICKRKPNNGE